MYVLDATSKRFVRPSLELLEGRLAPAVHTWTGAASNLWSDDANWQGGSPAGDPKAELVFPVVGMNRTTINDLDNLAVESIFFPSSFASPYTLRGNPFALGGGGIQVGAPGDGAYFIENDLVLQADTTFSGTGGQTPGFYVRGVIRGDYAVTTRGGVYLSGANTYTGGTNILGRVYVANREAFGTGEILLNGTIYGLSNGSPINNPYRLSFFGTLTGDSGVTMLGPGYLQKGSTLQTTGGSVISILGGLDGEGSVVNRQFTRLVLGGVNRYAGATIIESGSLQLSTSTALPEGAAVRLLPVNGRPVFNLNGFDMNLGALSSSGEVEVMLGSATLTTGGIGLPTTFSGVISGTGSVIKVGTGTWTLSGNSTFAGGLTVAEGAVRLDNRTAAGVGPLHVAGGTVEITANVTVSNTIVNEGTLRVETSRTLNLTPYSFHNAGLVELQYNAALRAGDLYDQTAGLTLLYDGTLGARSVRIAEGSYFGGYGLIDSNVANAGTLDVGGYGVAGTLAITGDYLQDAVGSLWLELGDAASGHYDRLAIGGEAELAGSLVVLLLDDFVLREGDLFEVLTWEAVEGGFDYFFLPDLGDPFFLDPRQDKMGLTLRTSRP